MINLLSALAVRENVVRLEFDVAPYFSSVLDPGDGSDPARYAITPDPSSRGNDGFPPRSVFVAMAQLSGPTSIDIWTDRKLSPFPAVYEVTVNSLLDAATLGNLNIYRATFLGLRAGRPSPQPQNVISNADIANPQTFRGALGSLSVPSDALLGTLPVDETGDLAKDEGLESYRKRVLRRLSTKKDRYLHLPGYGVLAVSSVKMLARPGTIQSIAADAEEQIRQEPETVDVRVDVVTQGSLAFYRIKVRCSFGQTVDLLAPIAITG